MKTLNSTLQSNKKTSLSEYFRNINFNQIAKNSCFKKRKPKKIKPKDLLLSFISMLTKDSNSFRLWSLSLLAGFNVTVSKNAIWKRINEPFSIFVRIIFQKVLAKQLFYNPKKFKKKIFSHFKRVLIQDSTAIPLPSFLKRIFPGYSKQRGKTAGAKIQFVFDLLLNRYSLFKLTSYTKNDQSESKGILGYIQKGDLIIRDLGYFTIECFREINKLGADFLSRFFYNTVIYIEKQEKRLNLIKILKKKKYYDGEVLIGLKEKFKVRLVAIPLPKELAEGRIRKAKQNADRRFTYKPKYFEYLQYLIYITSVSNDEWSLEDVAVAYGFRWKVENIFKCWKSNFHIDKLFLHKGRISKVMVESSIYAILIYITITMVSMYNYYLFKTQRIKDKYLSIFKWTEFVANSYLTLLKKTDKEIVEILIRYCTYDKRNDRKNMIEMLVLS